MFNLSQSRTFKATVTVSVAQEGGGFKEESFIAEFNRAADSEREELLALKNSELVRRQLVGWSMKDAQRKDVPFSEENLEAFLLLTGAVRETVLTFWRANTGAREKN